MICKKKIIWKWEMINYGEYMTYHWDYCRYNPCVIEVLGIIKELGIDNSIQILGCIKKRLDMKLMNNLNIVSKPIRAQSNLNLYDQQLEWQLLQMWHLQILELLFFYVFHATFFYNLLYLFRLLCMCLSSLVLYLFVVAFCQWFVYFFFFFYT